MAMEQISTGYVPDGPLGGFYQGINAANAQSYNNQQLANTALDQITKQRDAYLAQKQMDSPDWANAKVAGDIGTSQSAQASGNLAMKTNESDIQAKVQENIKKTGVDKVQTQLNDMKSKLAAWKANGPAGLATIMPTLNPEEQYQLSQLGPEEFFKKSEQLVNLTEEGLSRTATSIAAERLQSQKDAADAARAAATAASALEGHKYTADKSLEGHRLAADATIAAAKLRQNSEDKIKTFEAQAVDLDKKALSAKTPEQRAFYAEEAKKAFEKAQEFKVVVQKLKSDTQKEVIQQLVGEGTPQSESPSTPPKVEIGTVKQKDGVDYVRTPEGWVPVQQANGAGRYK